MKVGSGSRSTVFGLALATACSASLPSASALSQTLKASPASASVAVFPADHSREVAEAQVLLDRTRFSPGAIDGLEGGNTRKAVKAFQRAQSMTVTGRVDAALLDALRSGGAAPAFNLYTVTEADVAGPFRDVPDGMAAMSELDELAYSGPAEALAERFHMTQSFLEALNPGAAFDRAGTEITVAAAQDSPLDVPVSRIEVDGSRSIVRAFGGDGSLVATYPATVGSARFPSPSGETAVRAVAPAPDYYFSPEGRDWGPDRRLVIAAGPNNPVGSTWIDLERDGYGIHGTPEPRLIGKTASHGCVRLTNWDASTLARAVRAGTAVVFTSPDLSAGAG